MELILKAAAAALLSAFACLLIKRTNPELSFALTVFVSASIIFAALRFMESFTEFIHIVRRLISGSERYIMPVLKCTGIGISTRLASQLCKDASQHSVAASVEIAGTVCALAVSMPLIVSMLNMLGGMA